MSPSIEVGGRPVWHEVVGGGPPVVLVHGGMVGAESWRAQTDALVAAGYRVFAPERRGLRAPTLVLQGDRDDVRLGHSVDVVAALPDARLAVLPGSHMLPIETPDVVNALLLSFLRGDGRADSPGEP